MRGLRVQLMFWWHYGAEGGEKFFRAFLASLAGLSLLVFLLQLGGVIHLALPPISKLADLPISADMETLATALGIASAIMAGACMTFMGVLVPQLMDAVGSPRSDLRIRALIGLAVAFLASFVAALTFGILVAVTDVTASPQHWAVMFAALTLLVTSSLLLIFVLILLIPNRASKRFGDEFGTIFSSAWFVFFGLLIMMGQAAPEWGVDSGLPILAAMFISTLQIVVPHGYQRWKRGEDSYRDFVARKSSRANYCFMVTIVVAVAVLFAVLAFPGLCRRCIVTAIWLLLGLWSTGLLFLQIWVEGTRKMPRYARFPDDFFAQHPEVVDCLKAAGRSTERF
jgi:hypothetical protein